MPIFIVMSSWQGHCKSALGSLAATSSTAYTQSIGAESNMLIRYHSKG